MSLINCPECGHELSTAAVACPNCGRPIDARPTIERNVVIAKTPRKEGFPKWAIIPLAVLGALLVIVLFIMMARDDDSANDNLRVNVNTRRPEGSSLRTEQRSESNIGTATGPSTITVPESQSITVPGSQTGVTGVPPPAPSRGTVVIDAKVATRTGTPQAVRNEKFYLLDKDLDTILSDADLEPIEGNTLVNSFGLSVMFPNRYSEFHRAALRAINDHIKYSGTTDAVGRARLAGVVPDSYYLFGVTKAGRGFAIWNSPVSINPGENILNLTPQPPIEINVSSGG